MKMRPLGLILFEAKDVCNNIRHFFFAKHDIWHCRVRARQPGIECHLGYTRGIGDILERQWPTDFAKWQWFRIRIDTLSTQHGMAARTDLYRETLTCFRVLGDCICERHRTQDPNYHQKAHVTDILVRA